MSHINKINHPVLKTICLELKITSLKDLADYLKLPKGTIYSWDKLCKILNYDLIIERLPDFDPIFLLTGRGEIYKNKSANKLLKYNESLEFEKFEKVLQYLNLMNIQEFAERFDIKYSRIKKWQSSGKLLQKDKYLLIELLPEINPEFLLTGRGIISVPSSAVNEDKMDKSYVKKLSIVNEIMKALNIPSLTLLSAKTGIPMNTLSIWSRLSNIPIPQRLIDALPEVNPNFIIEGIGNVLKHNSDSEIIRDKIVELKNWQEQMTRKIEEKDNQMEALNQIICSQKEIIRLLKKK